MAPIVKLENLKKQYMLGSVPVNALCGIDLTVEQGDLVAILGPSGSGKSTLLNMIGLLDRPTEGTVWVEGIDTATLKDSQRVEVRRRIGFVFQFFNLIPRLTARENVELPMTIIGLSRKERRQRTEELLKAVGLGDRMNHKSSELSGGERQRVAIARALAPEPQILLLDEPTANIDAEVEGKLQRVLQKLNERMTILVATHDLGFVSKLVKSVICVNRTVAVHPTGEICGKVIQELYHHDQRLVRHDKFLY
ncbi:MAG: ABC transporter ATP-binding protein [Spirochaetes bacterium]|nr:ABC transporter ATP-binding protein [Spirochaetota bacterium]